MLLREPRVRLDALDRSDDTLGDHAIGDQLLRAEARGARRSGAV